MTPRQFAERLSTITVPSKDQLPWIKVATLGDIPKSDKTGCLRHNRNIRRVYGVEADYDGEELPLAWAEAKLHDAGLAAVIYTSPSHRPDAPRWRVLCFTSRPVWPREREQLMARLMGVLAGTLDPASFTLAQAYLFGGLSGQPSPRVRVVDGMAIDLADHLDADALDKRGKPYGREAMLEPEPDDGDDDLRAAPDWDLIDSALAVVPADEREAWLTVGQVLHYEDDGGEDGFERWEEWSRSSSKYDPQDQRRVWESFGSYVGKPRTIGTLLLMAKQHTKGQADPEGHLRLFTPEECENLPPVQHLVEDVLAPRQVACVFGAPGSGKSALVPYLAWRVAQGDSFFGKDTERGVVFYVSPDDDHGMARRIVALRRRYADAPGFFRVSPDGGPWSDFFAEGSKHVRQLRELIEMHRPALVVIDTLASGFNSLDENDGLQMKRAVRISRSLTEYGAALVLVHHSQKGEGAKTPRGSGVLDGDMDMTIHVTRSENGLIRGKLKKNRIGGLDAAEITFRVAAEPVGVSAKGKATTAAVLEEVTSSEPREARVPPLQMRLLALLDELAGKDGHASRAAMREIAISTNRISSADKQDSRKRTFNEGMAELSRCARIAIDGDEVTRVLPDANVFDRHDDEDDEI